MKMLTGLALILTGVALGFLPAPADIVYVRLMMIPLGVLIGAGLGLILYGLTETLGG